MNTIKQKEFIKAFVFNLRWGQLLERERSRAGVSRETLATAFGLDPLEVGRWETGFGSPIASVFYKIIVFLGPEAYRSAAGLWFAMQVEQTGAVAVHCLRVERRPCYLALGAIRDRYKELAA